MRGPQFTGILTDAPTEQAIDEDERLVSFKEAQHRLADVTRRQIYNYIAAGRLQARKMGGRRVILESSLRALIQEVVDQDEPVVPKQRAGVA